MALTVVASAHFSPGFLLLSSPFFFLPQNSTMGLSSHVSTITLAHVILSTCISAPTDVVSSSSPIDPLIIVGPLFVGHGSGPSSDASCAPIGSSPTSLLLASPTLSIFV